jgi:hypothetical protein
VTHEDAPARKSNAGDERNERNERNERIERTEPALVRLGLALVAMCTTATALYAVVRVAQALIFPEPDPALVIWSEHAGFFWRSWTVGYVGGMAAFLTWLASARHAARVASVLARAVPVAAALLTAQALLVP